MVAPSGSAAFSVSVRYKDGCGNYHVPLHQISNYNTSIFTEPYSVNGQPCSAPSQPRPVLYPNPAVGSLTAEHWQGDVRLYNTQGRVVWQSQVPVGASRNIDTRSLPNGLYYIAGNDVNGHPARQTVQIQH